MKKFLIYLVLAIPLLFSYNIANASDTNNLDIIIGNDANFIDIQNEWLYNQTTNIKTFTDNYDYYVAYYTFTPNGNWVTYNFNIYGFNTEYGLCVSGGLTGVNGYIEICPSTSGATITRNGRYFVSWQYNYVTGARRYLVSGNNYQTFTDFSSLISANKIDIDITATTLTQDYNVYRLFYLGGGSTADMYGFQVYDTNMNIYNTTRTNAHNRDINIKNYSDSLILNTYVVGDLFPSYVTYYHSLPSYLTGYKKVDLTTFDKYIMISDISSGSVYIPTAPFNEYGGRLSYFDKELDTQPYTSYIDNYYNMPDGLYVRQDFNLDNYSGADWVMFSKYLYIEGEDNISYSIYIPDSSYDSGVTITPNNQGGNDFDYSYKDNEGNIQTDTITSIDFNATNPLLGTMFQDFSSNTFGLTSIITAPLSLIYNITSNTCNSLELPLPFVNSSLTLPCMTELYSTYFGDLFTIYQTITFGLIAYWVCVRVFNLVKDFKNPDHDEIEVLDL